MTVNKWARIALFNFLLASLFGTLLRYAFVHEVKWMDFMKFESAHWHLALLGWIYQSLFAFLCSSFIPAEKLQHKKYNIIFWTSQILILAIVISLAVTGYRMVSLSLLISLALPVFYFIYSFFRDTATPAKPSFALSAARMSLAFLGLSFSGIIVMIPVLVLSSVKKSILFYLGSQFFLHFQYNGWMTFAILALLFRMADTCGIAYSMQKLQLFKRIMAAAAVLTYCLSVYWGYPHQRFFLWIAAGAGLAQVIAMAYAWNEITHLYRALKPELAPTIRSLFSFSFISYLLKLLLQSIVIVPFFASLSFTIRNYIIAYLHLMLIGVVSLFLVGWSLQRGYLQSGNRSLETGVTSLITGFVAVELMLVLQGTMLWLGEGFIPYYHHIIFGVTLFLPLGLLLIFIKTNAGQAALSSTAKQSRESCA